MTTHQVPTVTIRQDGDTFYLVVSRHQSEGDPIVNEVPLVPIVVDTEYAAERIAQYARGALADAFHAGQVEATQDTIAEMGDERIAELELQVRNAQELVTSAREERDAANALVEQRNEYIRRVNETELGQLNERVELLTAERDEWQQRNERQTQRINEQEARIGDFTRTVSEYHDTNNHLHDRTGELERELATAREQTTDDRVTELQTRVNALASDREDLIGQIDRLRELQANQLHDLELTWERAMDFAQDKGYCSDFDDFRDDVAAELRTFTPPSRITEWTADLVVTVEFQLRRGQDENEQADVFAAELYRAAQHTGSSYSVRSYEANNVYEA